VAKATSFIFIIESNLREWELSFRLGMRPWIAVAYSAPVAAATAVFIIYPIGQGSFSDGMPLGKFIAPSLNLISFIIITILKEIWSNIYQLYDKKKPILFSTMRLLFSFSLRRTPFRGSSSPFPQRGTRYRGSSKQSFFYKRIFMIMKQLMETCLNRETPNFSCTSADNQNSVQPNVIVTASTASTASQDNPVLNRIQPRKQPGLYMVHCLVNDKRYYGESKNVSARLNSHRSLLNRKIHPNTLLQHDWNTYGINNFEFIVLFMGSTWEKHEDRLCKETELILADRSLCYNYLVTSSRPLSLNPFFGKRHSEETKKAIGDAMRNVPKDSLGTPIVVNGIIYPSITEASRQTGHARKTLRNKLNNGDPNVKKVSPEVSPESESPLKSNDFSRLIKE
jgi:hypothetical protein